MDDEIRWNAVEDYLLREGGKPAIEIIKVDIPGNYPHEFMFILLFLLLILYYLFHPA